MNNPVVGLTWCFYGGETPGGWIRLWLFRRTFGVFATTMPPLYSARCGSRRNKEIHLGRWRIGVF